MRAVRTLAIGLAGLLLLLAAAAWLAPPLLNWGRYRATIASVAAARLGRPVEIGGEVTLRLLPHAVLTATEVTLPDQGDGLSARLATLRLQVALGALLGGRIVATDLVLGGPVLHLPWPLPAAIADPLRPPTPRRFGARVEGGSLTIGRLALGDISASLVGDATVGSLRASGQARSAGLPWRFRVVLGAPGTGGTSPVDIAVAGQDRLRDTGGTFAGRLSGTQLAGDIDLGGGDLSLLLSGPRLPWRVRGAMSARRDRIEAPALALETEGGSARADVALALAGPPRLDVNVATPSLELALWAPLGRRAASLGVPFSLGLSADRAPMLGDQLSGLGLRIAGDGASVRLEQARAVLPGGAVATLSGTIGSDKAGQPTVLGPFTLVAPDLRTTSRWLRPLAPALLDVIPGGLLPANAMTGARLQAQARLSRAGIEAQGLSLTLGDDHAEGSLAVRLGARPGITADLRVDRLTIDAGAPRLPARLEDPGLDADIQLHAMSTTLWGLSLADLSAHAKAGPGGVQLLRASAMLAAAAVSASGKMGLDGALADARFFAGIQDLSQAMDEAPPGWRSRAPLWHGPAAVEISVSGPQDALALQLRAEAGDMRIEAESLLDTRLRQASATLTLRHPGAPRLLADLGLPGTAAWLDTGSVALLSHLRLAPERVTVRDFVLNIASLRASGTAVLDLGGKVPKLDGIVRAETLPLPGWAAWQAMPGLPHWAATASTHLHVQAGELLVGLRPVATLASADIGVEQGIVLAEPVSATVAGGALSAELAADIGQSPPRVAVRAELAGASLQGRLTGLPVDPVDTTLDLAASLEATGASATSLAASAAGEAEARVTSASVTGLDLPRLIQSLTLPQRLREPALRAALSGGATTGFAGALKAGISGGRITIRQGLLSAPSGTIDVSGSADVKADTANLHIVAKPAVASPPSVGIDLSGGWNAARRSDNLAEALNWGTPSQTQARPARPVFRHPRKPHRP